jgi:hypothetical protein
MVLDKNKYEKINFKKENEKTACDYCCFELGKCRSAILILGQCFIHGEKNIYYIEKS